MFNKSRIGFPLVVALSGVGVALLLVAAACTSSEGSVAAEPGERTLYVQATELDARRGLDQDPFPQDTRDAFPDYFGPADDPFDSAGAPGYYLFMTEEEEWRIGSYMFIPQEATVYEGDQVTMEILGVRGGHHGNILVDPDGERVQGPDGNDIRFDVKRGELHQIEFTADKTGVYQLICVDHTPTMAMNIHVLPR